MEDKKVERIDFKRIFIDKVEENFWIEHLTQNIGKLKASIFIFSSRCSDKSCVLKN